MALSEEMGTRPVKAVWTDFAGVLTPPLPETFAVFCARTGLDYDVLMAAVGAVTRTFGTSDFMEPVDTPLISEDEWLGRIAAELPAADRAKLPRPTIADVWFHGRPPNQKWIDHLRSLKERGYRVGLMSNIMPSWDAYWRRMVPADELFDDVVLSFAVGHRKPHREIYDLAARRSGVQPSECLFVDDSADNCAGARAAGWHAVHFTGTAGAIDAVERVLRAAVGPPAPSGTTDDKAHRESPGGDR